MAVGIPRENRSIPDLARLVKVTYRALGQELDLCRCAKRQPTFKLWAQGSIALFIRLREVCRRACDNLHHLARGSVS